MFFLESSLLVLLLRKAGYGYSLIDGLEGFGFQVEQLDASIVYRALRELEAARRETQSDLSRTTGTGRTQ